MDDFLILRDTLSKLDRNKIHILFFSYKTNFKNLYKTPLLAFTKLYNFIRRSKSVDHVCFINRFEYDELRKQYEPFIFESAMSRGVEESSLFEKLRGMKGTCYIATLSKVRDARKSQIFEDKYYGVPYSKLHAFLSGYDLGRRQSCIISSNDMFCSWLTALFLVDQGEGFALCPSEMTPTDLYEIYSSRVLWES